MSGQNPPPAPQKSSLPILASAPRGKDPVCGMMVDPQKPAAKVEHNDKTYYFCSQRCADRFEKEPEKFLARPGTAGMESSASSRPDAHSGHAATITGQRSVAAKDVRYTCPMHPEIVQIGPGSCPICGMALEPMDAFAEKVDVHIEKLKTYF